jgi:ABC-type phosphate transport system substrate-binding protein
MTRRTYGAALLLGLGLALAGEAGAQQVVAVVSARSQVPALRAEQVADIFLGKATRFPDGTYAVPIDQVEDSEVRDRFYAQYAGKSPAQVKAHWAKIIFTGRGQPPRQVPDSVEARKAIAANPNAIGYIDSRHVDPSVRVLAAR